MTRSRPPRPSAREDLLATALELFSRKGIGVGIDEVTRTAGRTRDTLYRVFGNKTGLVVATLSRYGDQLPWLEFLRRAEADRRRPADPGAQATWARDKLYAVMQRVADWGFQQGAHGCYLLVAAAELRGNHEPALARHSIGQVLLVGGLGWAAWERPRWSRSVVGILGGLRGVLTPAR